jgi:hypothetical protein
VSKLEVGQIRKVTRPYYLVPGSIIEILKVDLDYVYYKYLKNKNYQDEFKNIIRRVELETDETTKLDRYLLGLGK